MDLKELHRQKVKIKENVVRDSNIERALIEEAARAGVDIKYFIGAYNDAKESLRGKDPGAYELCEKSNEGLRKDLLTITIVNAYETIRSDNKKE